MPVSYFNICWRKTSQPVLVKVNAPYQKRLKQRNSPPPLLLFLSKEVRKQRPDLFLPETPESVKRTGGENISPER